MNKLQKEKDKGTKKKVGDINRHLAELKEKSRGIILQWKTEKEIISAIRNHKKEIDKFRSEADMLERKGELDKVAEIRYGKIPEIENKIKGEERKLEKIQKDNPMLKEEVTEEDIAKVVSRWTGVPVSKCLS